MMGMGDEEVLFNLRWDAQRSALLGSVASLYKEESLVDSTLVVDGQIFKTHKLILSASSDYLHKILQGVYQQQHPIIFLPTNIKPKDLENVLKFVYEGEIKISRRSLKSFLELTKLLKIKGMDFELDDDELEFDKNPENDSNTKRVCSLSEDDEEGRMSNLNRGGNLSSGSGSEYNNKRERVIDDGSEEMEMELDLSKNKCKPSENPSDSHSHSSSSNNNNKKINPSEIVIVGRSRDSHSQDDTKNDGGGGGDRGGGGDDDNDQSFTIVEMTPEVSIKEEEEEDDDESEQFSVIQCTRRQSSPSHLPLPHGIQIKPVNVNVQNLQTSQPPNRLPTPPSSGVGVRMGGMQILPRLGGGGGGSKADGILMRMMRDRDAISSSSSVSGGGGGSNSNISPPSISILASGGSSGSYFDLNESSGGKSFLRKNRKISCSSCNKILSSLSALKRHMEDVHQARIQGKCIICGRVYSSRNSLLTHVYSAHKLHSDYKAVARIIRESDFEKFASI